MKPITLLVFAMLAQFAVLGKMVPATSNIFSISNMSWLGEYGVPPSVITCVTTNGGNTGGGGGGAMAIRYIGAHTLANRRILMQTAGCGLANGRIFGDLIEMREPTVGECPGGLYTATNDPTQACPLVETRRWANWTNFDSWDSGWQDTANGDIVSALYWDSTNNVLWGTVIGAYTAHNMPVLVAAQLLDTCNTSLNATCTSTPGSDYYNVGNKYDFFYRSNVGGANSFAHLEWKSVNDGITPVPSFGQGPIGNSTLLMGSIVGSVGGSGQLGPGLTGFTSFPVLPTTPDSTCPTASPDSGCVLAQGMNLANYTEEFCDPITPNAHRDTNYTFLLFAGHSAVGGGVFPPSGGTGFWAMSRDSHSGFAYINTGTRNAILSFGRIVGGLVGYGDNPYDQTEGPLNTGSITSSGTSTATVTDPSLNAQVNYVAGTTVIHIHCVKDAGTADLSTSFYDGDFTVASTPDATHLTYLMSGVPSGAGVFDASRTDSLGNVCGSSYGQMLIRGIASPVPVDPTRANPEHQHGYFATVYNASIWMFDPNQFAQAAAGTRDYCSYDFHTGPFNFHGGVNPVNIGNWHTQWPNIHVSVDGSGYNGTDGSSELLSSFLPTADDQWDNDAQQLLWMYTQSQYRGLGSAASPMLQYFHIS